MHSSCTSHDIETIQNISKRYSCSGRLKQEAATQLLASMADDDGEEDPNTKTLCGMRWNKTWVCCRRGAKPTFKEVRPCTL
eukprot:SAG11_NODE_2218_length_3676_cov_3.617557_6_plen_81_part_00